MPCFYPMTGYRSRKLSEGGKRKIVFNVKEGFEDLPVTIPCGQCVGCRLERSRQWAMRCMHEAKLYENNCFVTLTYTDSALPEFGSLSVDDHQRFMKRLKGHVARRFGRSSADRIRFYMCGEYGEKLGRPHYHFCMFDWDFPDKVYKRHNSLGDAIYTSDLLAKAWPYGAHEIGSVTWQSAAYVARYVMKKITGDDAIAYYGDKLPEYTAMSRNPGIGRGFYEKFTTDIHPRGYVIHDGVKHRVPRFYDSVFEIDNPEAMRRLKGIRKRSAAVHAADNTPERRRVREKVQQLRLERLKRGLIE